MRRDADQEYNHAGEGAKCSCDATPNWYLGRVNLRILGVFPHAACWLCSLNAELADTPRIGRSGLHQHIAMGMDFSTLPVVFSFIRQERV